MKPGPETNIFSVPFWVFLLISFIYLFILFFYSYSIYWLIVYSFIHKQMKDMQPIVYRQKTFHRQSSPCIMVFFFVCVCVWHLMSYSMIKVEIGSVNSSMTPLTPSTPRQTFTQMSRLPSVLFHDITVFGGGSRDLRKQVPLVPRSTWRHHQRQQCEKRERCIMGVVGKKQWRQLGEDEPVFSRERKEKERKKTNQSKRGP